LTAALSLLPAETFTPVDAAIWIASPGRRVAARARCALGLLDEIRAGDRDLGPVCHRTATS